jgi:hypothetical protein
MGLKLEVFKVEGKLYWVAPYPGWNRHYGALNFMGLSEIFAHL